VYRDHLPAFVERSTTIMTVMTCQTFNYIGYSGFREHHDTLADGG
jgi:hypothetical protein